MAFGKDVLMKACAKQTNKKINVSLCPQKPDPKSEPCNTLCNLANTACSGAAGQCSALAGQDAAEIGKGTEAANAANAFGKI